MTDGVPTSFYFYFLVQNGSFFFGIDGRALTWPPGTKFFFPFFLYFYIFFCGTTAVDDDEQPRPSQNVDALSSRHTEHTHTHTHRRNERRPKRKKERKKKVRGMRVRPVISGCWEPSLMAGRERFFYGPYLRSCGRFISFSFSRAFSFQVFFLFVCWWTIFTEFYRVLPSFFFSPADVSIFIAERFYFDWSAIEHCF